MNWISHRNFISILSPAEKFAAMGAIEKFDADLKAILEEEIIAGNLISRVLKGWPQADSISVVLSESFLKKYENEGVEYVVLGPHEGEGLYRSKKSNDTLLH